MYKEKEQNSRKPKVRGAASSRDAFQPKRGKAKQRRVSKTDMPDQSGLGVENFSGLNMNDVNEHHNPDNPDQSKVHVNEQGTDSGVASGQENKSALQKEEHGKQAGENGIADVVKKGSEEKPISVKREKEKGQERENTKLGGVVSSTTQEKPEIVESVPSSQLDTEPAKEQETVNLPTGNSQEYFDGLTNLKPISFVDKLGQSTNDVQQAYDNEKSSLKSSLPEIPKPTGLPAKTEGAGQVVEKMETLPTISSKINLDIQLPSGEKEQQQVHEESQQALLTTDPFNVEMGQPPKVNLSGQANPVQNQSNLETSSHEVVAFKANSDAASLVSRGENDIFPQVSPETLSPSVELSPVQAPSSLEEDLPPIPPEIKDRFDAGTQAHLDKQLAPEKAKQAAEYEKMKVQEQQERANTEAQISAETQIVKENQEAAQQQAQAEVSAYRADWQRENQAIEEEFANKSVAEKAKVDASIEAKVRETDTQVATTYSQAQKQTDEQIAITKKEAQNREDEAKKKGWFDRAVDATKNLFNKLKEGINALFDGLRKVVKNIVEGAKKLANNLIDAARNVITGMIQSFGQVLKGLVNVVLAAFPKLRQKFNALIDKAVSIASQVVNTLAEGLKKTVSAMLDLLGTVLDSILAAYQAFYNLLIDALKVIALAILKVLSFLVNLLKGIALSPLAFPSELAKESLGGDPSQPLPNFEVPLGQEDAWAKAMGITEEKEQVNLETNETTATVSSAIQELLTKQELSDEDVIIDPNPAIHLEPTILNQLSILQDGQEMDLGGAGSEGVTTEDFQATAAYEAGFNMTTLNDTFSSGSLQTPDVIANQQETEVAGGSDPDWRNMTDQQKLDYYLEQMLQPVQEAGAQEPSPQESETTVPNQELSEEALITKTGRLSVGQRLIFMGKQMLTGIQVMWQQYKGWIIAGLTTALIAAGAIAFFTGGAGLAFAVNILAKAMTYYFGAKAISNAYESIEDYVRYAWNGDPRKAAQSLAKALAIIVSEFFMDKILPLMGKMFKRFLKSTKTGTKVLEGLTKARGFVKRGVSASKGVVQKGIAKIKNSKLVVALRGKVGKGAKSFGDLRERILQRFKFKRMWFEKKGTRIQLWGKFNATVLLMEVDDSGSKSKNLDYLYKKDSSGNPSDAITVVGGNKTWKASNTNEVDNLIGKNINDLKEAPEGFQFYIRGGKKRIRRKNTSDPRTPTRLTVDNNGNIVKYTGSQRISKSGKLRKNLGNPPAKNHEAHHLVPDNVVRDSPLHQEAIKRGLYDIDRKSNGRYLSKTDEDAVTGVTKELPRHSGSHPNYDVELNKVINEYTNALKKNYPGLDKVPEDVLKQVVTTIENRAGSILKGWKSRKLN